MVALCALTLAACDASGDGAETSRPRAGGMLTVAILEPKSIDPSRTSDADRAGERPGLLVLSALCDPLVAAHPRTGALRPGVAESWQVALDGKKVTFKLRAGARFHNGREITAEDYVYSISRFVHPDTSSDQYFFFERVAGYKDLRERRSQTLAGVKALDPRTLEVELAEPFAELPAVLAHPAAGSVVPKDEVAKGADAFAMAPVCNGPYAMAAPWQRGQDLRLVRAKDYARTSSVHSRDGAGYADEIVFKTVPDLEAGYELLEEKAVQVADVPVNRIAPGRVRGLRIENRSNGLLSYLGFPVTRPPFDKPEVRRALSLALDRSEIVDTLLAGTREVATGFLPGSAGRAARGAACPDTIKAKVDARGASTALQAAGVDPAATKLTVYFNDGASGHQAWLEKVAGQWKSALKLDSTLQPQEFKLYLDFLAEGKADGPFRLAWPADYPSPESIFGPLFAGGSLDNYTMFRNQAFDDLLARARATPDERARRGVYTEAAKVLCSEMPAAPVWFGANHIGLAAGLPSAVRSPTGLLGEPLVRELGTRS